MNLTIGAERLFENRDLLHGVFGQCARRGAITEMG